MGNPNAGNTLKAQRTSRSLLAITLAASLAAFSCTTNRNLGNGTPTRSGPDVRTAPTSGVTSGGETTSPSPNPPMMSSYSRSDETLSSVSMRSGVIRRSPDEAAAIMAGRQTLHGRYLGVVSPESGGRPYVSNVQMNVNPALQTNPQITVNSSISSQPHAVITPGTEATVDTGGAVVAGATVAATTTTTTVASDANPTTAAAGVPIGAIAGTSPLPTLASAGNPSVTAASVGLGRTAAQTAGTTTTATMATTDTSTATTAATTSTTRVGSVASPIRVLRGTNGSVTVTNVSSSATPTTVGGGSQ